MSFFFISSRKLLQTVHTSYIGSTSSKLALYTVLQYAENCPIKLWPLQSPNYYEPKLIGPLLGRPKLAKCKLWVTSISVQLKANSDAYKFQDTI